MRRSQLKRKTPLRRKTPLKRSGRLSRKSTLRSKGSKAGTRKPSALLLNWRSHPHRCLVCGMFPCDPHHKTPRSRPKDLPDGMKPDASENLVPMCRPCHAEYGALLGEPTKSWLHREAMLANARVWIARHPGAREALPGWLLLALEEEGEDGNQDCD